MKHATLKTINTIIILLIASNISYAQKNQLPTPDMANVKYGEHERNELDIWFADKGKKTPLAIFIHGGGFIINSKENLNVNELSQLLKAGISVASINYRYKTTAPLPAPHYDAKKALQFIRSKAELWRIDENKVGIWGSSAGAQICMWLAFSDEMANAASVNPIERESTRVTCVATKIGQTTLESVFWLKHLGKYAPGTEAEFNGKSRLQTFGVETIEEADEIAKSISALALISADDPPIFMQYGMAPNAPVPNNNQKKVRGWIVHHVDFGIALKEKMDELGVEAHLRYPDSETQYETVVKFLTTKLLEE